MQPNQRTTPRPKLGSRLTPLQKKVYYYYVDTIQQQVPATNQMVFSMRRVAYDVWGDPYKRPSAKILTDSLVSKGLIVKQTAYNEFGSPMGSVITIVDPVQAAKDATGQR